MAPAPQASDIPTHRLTAPPSAPPSAPADTAVDAGAPAQSPALAPPATGAPAASPGSQRKTPGWARAHWRLVVSVVALLVIVVAALGVYNYASTLAAQPGRVMASYCAALTHTDYKTAYSLLAPSLRAQSTLAQYEADSAARDAISGRVKGCASKPTQQLSALSFLRDPRSLVYNLTLTRASAERGQVALTRNATGWEVAALSSTVAGVDLGPLHMEQALCAAFIARKYDVAYGLLSTPYQREQGSETVFATAFGSNLAITGCEPTLSGYTVDRADQRASFMVTLDVSVAGDSSTTKLTLPALMTLVREAAGWRVDTITPTLGQ
jgi:hypothetical protein